MYNTNIFITLTTDNKIKVNKSIKKAIIKKNQ